MPYRQQSRGAGGARNRQTAVRRRRRSPFTPAQISGLQGWYRADSLALAGDAEVATWSDMSGKANDLVKSSTGPTFKTGIRNGRPVVRFDGTDDNLLLADTSKFRGTSGMTIFMACSLTTEASAFIMGTRNSFTSLFGWNIYTHSTTDGIEVMRGGNAGDNQIWLEQSADFGAEATWSVRSYSFAAGSQSFRHNGTAYITGTDATLHDAGTTAFTLMADPDLGATTYMAGDIGELLIYEPSITSAEIARIEKYLAERWGVNLP